MIIPDVNLLLYAHLRGFPAHGAAKKWLESALSSDEDVGFVAPSIFGFIRVATHRKIIQPPMSVEHAMTCAREMLAARRACFLAPGPRHLEIAFDLLGAIGAASNLTTDVQLAAYAIESRGVVYSNDSDFGRIPGVRWVTPLS